MEIPPKKFRRASLVRALLWEFRVTIDVDYVRIRNRIFNPVQMGDLFEALYADV